MKKAVFAPLLLCACSPIGDDRIQTGATSSSGTYETIDSTAAVTSTLGGVTLQTSDSATNPALRRNSGSLTHNTGQIVFTDGTYELVDPDGITNGLVTDGTSIMVVTAAQGFSTNYDHVRAYNQTYVADSTAYSTEGFVGIVTSAADMPSSGTASWTGEAEGTFTTSAGIVDLDDGTAAISANFGSNTLSADMTGFTPRSRTTGGGATVSFDSIEISGATIAGNAFSGGTLVTTSSGTTVDVTGTRSEESIAGNFYGLDSSGIPDEVAGAANIIGADGSLTTIFIAD